MAITDMIAKTTYTLDGVEFEVFNYEEDEESKTTSFFIDEDEGYSVTYYWEKMYKGHHLLGGYLFINGTHCQQQEEVRNLFPELFVGKPTKEDMLSKAIQEADAFDDWMNQIDCLTQEDYGLSIHDIEDMPFRDNYDAGMSPNQFMRKIFPLYAETF